MSLLFDIKNSVMKVAATTVTSTELLECIATAESPILSHTFPDGPRPASDDF